MRRASWGCLASALFLCGALACSEGVDPPATSRLAADRADYQLLDTVLDRALRLRATDLAFVADRAGPAAWSRLDAALPLSGDGALRVSAGGLTLEVTPLGRVAVPGQLAGAAAVYPGAYPGADAVLVVEPGRVEELVLFRQGPLPATMDYRVQVTAGQGRVSIRGGVVQVLDHEGAARLRLEPPFVVDAAGQRHAVAVRLRGDRLRLALPTLAAPALLDPGWITAGKLLQARRFFSATRLKSGKVLVCGGKDPDPYASLSLNSCELFDPLKRTWTGLSSTMLQSRRHHSATLLGNGKVLVVGGYSGKQNLASAELYDPAADKWAAAASLPVASRDHSATLLASGKVLVAGLGSHPGTTDTPAQLYDPKTGKWAATGKLNHPRAAHRAVRLNSGRVLVVGGGGKAPSGYPLELHTELYDPKSGTWSVVPGKVKAAFGHTLTLLSSGHVLAVGGAGNNQTSHLYDPAKNAWSAVPSPKPLRSRAVTFSLKSDRALLAGGYIITTTFNRYATAHIFDRATKTWTPAQKLGKPRAEAGGVALSSGALLVVAGEAQAHNTAELYDPTNGTTCKADKECALGFCSDGRCCTSRCHGMCMICQPGGIPLKCVPLSKGQPDLWPTAQCSGNKACYGGGQCRLKQGQPCTKGTQCVSNHCVDGYCCGAPCNQTCKACDVFGKHGTCSPVPAGKPDKLTCGGAKACDGNGGCKKANGQACPKGTDCGSGYCADGLCCDKACGGTCMACDLAGNKGACSAVPKNQQDKNGAVPCTGTNICDGKGACRLPQGGPCIVASQCITELCKDGVCCDKACDKTCESCKQKGKLGTCSAIAKGDDPDGECLGKDSKCGGACDGKRQCVFPGLGTGCGTCKACDGTGKCASAPPDDTACGVLDCDKLDTKCRDYQDVTTARCASFGSCKPGNDPVTCTKYSKLPCSDASVAPDKGAVPDKGAPNMDKGVAPDKGAPGPDQGGAAETEDSGCSVAGRGRSTLLWLGLLLLIIRRRESSN